MDRPTARQIVKLTAGTKYDASILSRFAFRWTDGDLSGYRRPYRVEDFFSADWVHLGPDCHNIEPLFFSAMASPLPLPTAAARPDKPRSPSPACSATPRGSC